MKGEGEGRFHGITRLSWTTDGGDQSSPTNNDDKEDTSLKN